MNISNLGEERRISLDAWNRLPVGERESKIPVYFNQDVYIYPAGTSERDLRLWWGVGTANGVAYCRPMGNGFQMIEYARGLSRLGT